MDCSLPGTCVHGMLQARILEWVAMPSSRGSYQPRDRTQAFCVAGRFFTLWATMEVPLAVLGKYVLFVDLSTLTDNLELNSWLYDGLYEASKRGQKKNQSPILWKPYTHCLHWTKGNRNDPVCILLCSPRLFKVYLKHQLLYQASWALHSECHLFFCFQSTSLYPWYSTSQTGWYIQDLIVCLSFLP